MIVNFTFLFSSSVYIHSFLSYNLLLRDYYKTWKGERWNESAKETSETWNWETCLCGITPKKSNIMINIISYKFPLKILSKSKNKKENTE